MSYTVPAVNFFGQLSNIGDTLAAGNDQANQQALQAYQQQVANQREEAAQRAAAGQPYNPPPLPPPPVPQSFLGRLYHGITGDSAAPSTVPSPVSSLAAAPANIPVANNPAMMGAIAPQGQSAAAQGQPQSSQPKNYFAKLAQVESQGDPNAVSPTGATGLFQFTKGTWDQYGNGGSRTDPNAQFAAVNKLTQDNQAALSQALGRPPTAGELYLAHQQGAGGAIKLLTNPNATPADLGMANAVAVNGGDPTAPAAQFVNKWTSKFADTSSPYAPPGQSPQSVATRAPGNLVAGPAMLASNATIAPVADTGASPISPEPGTPRPAIAQGVPSVNGVAPPGTVAVGGRNYTLPAAMAMLQSPYFKPIGEVILKKFGEQSGQIIPLAQDQRAAFGIPQDDTRVWTQNTLTGKPEPIASDKDTQTSEQKNYEYYKKQQDASNQPVMGFDQWATQKARAAATNVNLNTVPDAAADVINKAKGQVVADAINASVSAPTRLRSLSEISDAAKAGGDNITTGPMADIALRAKQIGSSLGIDIGDGLPASEAIQKVGFGLATQLTKAITNRPAQSEFLYALRNVPGLQMSGPGIQAMSSLLAQEAFQDRAIGRIAMQKGMTPEQFQEEQDKYIDEHPLLSPFTGKPFGASDIQLIAKRAGVKMPNKGAAENVPLPAPAPEPTFPSSPQSGPAPQTPSAAPKRFIYNSQGQLLPQ